jgi:hypothetical protein
MVAGCNIGLVGRVVVIQVVAQAYLQVAVHTVWRYYQYESENVVQKNCALNYSISKRSKTEIFIYYYFHRNRAIG